MWGMKQMKRIKSRNPSQLSQYVQIIEALCNGHKLTRVTAMLQLHIYNLTARISELRQAGWRIKGRAKVDLHNTLYTEYYMANEDKLDLAVQGRLVWDSMTGRWRVNKSWK